MKNDASNGKLGLLLMGRENKLKRGNNLTNVWFNNNFFMLIAKILAAPKKHIRIQSALQNKHQSKQAYLRKFFREAKLKFHIKLVLQESKFQYKPIINAWPIGSSFLLLLCLVSSFPPHVRPSSRSRLVNKLSDSAEDHNLTHMKIEEQARHKAKRFFCEKVDCKVMSTSLL